MRRLSPEYRAEPRVALAGGRDGLEFVRRLLAGADRHLTQSGALVVEIGASRAALARALPCVPFTWLTTGAGEGLVFALRREELAPRATHLASQRGSRQRGGAH
mgnify:CR=1 FL=1